MEDEQKDSQESPESKDLDVENADNETLEESERTKRPYSLKDATSKLKEEALRRYRENHGSADSCRKSINLRVATSRLKEEALRRYRKKHRESLDRHERELTDEFEKYKKGRASKSPTSPDINEVKSDAEVFENEYEAVDSENETQIQPESEALSVILKSESDSSRAIQDSSGSQLTEIQAASESQLTDKPVKKSKAKGKNPSKTKGKSQPKSKPKSKSDQKSPEAGSASATPDPQTDVHGQGEDPTKDEAGELNEPTSENIPAEEQQPDGNTDEKPETPKAENAEDTKDPEESVVKSENKDHSEDALKEKDPHEGDASGSPPSGPGSRPVSASKSPRPPSEPKPSGSRPGSRPASSQSKRSRPGSAASNKQGSRPGSGGQSQKGSRPPSGTKSPVDDRVVAEDDEQKPDDYKQEDAKSSEAGNKDEEKDDGETKESTEDKEKVTKDENDINKENGETQEGEEGQKQNTEDTDKTKTPADDKEEAIKPQDEDDTNKDNAETPKGDEAQKENTESTDKTEQEAENSVEKPSTPSEGEKAKPEDGKQDETKEESQDEKENDGLPKLEGEAENAENEKQTNEQQVDKEEEVQQSAAADVAPEGGEGAAAADVAPEVGEGAAAADVAPEGESVAVSEDQQSTDKPADDGVQPTDDGAQPSDAKPSEEVKPPLVEEGGAGAETSGAVDGTDPNIRGDEDEIMSEEILDDTPAIPDDFYYNLDEHVSRPAVTEDSGLPADLLTLDHSFGYDCQKRSNLLMMDTHTCVFAAGNVVQLLNLTTKQQSYIRSTSGGGIGALAVHPNHKYFAVAEKGEAPNIVIYEFPSLKLYRILRGGTQEQYAFISFSPDGKLLASVGGDPDYMLTVWDWKNEKTMLRSKAFSQDVFRVTFSADLVGQLTSSGTGHIRFWKMAKTFTGLKLQGQLGKFGKTEISDIEGYVELPDGKVLSGAEWGNMLVWDGGLIKVEISRKGGLPCHNGPIQQIIMDEGELMTIGTDGHIRVWDFETVDTADVTDESSVFEMDPMNELHVGNNVSLKTLVKSVDSEEPTIWYAQDANGGIWKLDLSFSFTSQAPEKLASYHSGAITGCDTSPVSHLVATTGVDKTVRVYDYLAKKQLCEARYLTGGSTLIWLPKTVDPKGSTLLVGFEDGVVRALNFHEKDERDVHGRKVKDSTELALKQAFKPHNGKVAAMAIDSKAEVLATGGDDCSVFFLTIGFDKFDPIGFVKTPSPVTHLEWSPGRFDRNTLLVCCLEGQVLEIECPEPGKFDTSHSFVISGLNIRTHDFKSIKSRLIHEEELAKKAKEEEERRKKEEEERRIRIERGLQTESDDEEEEEEKQEEEEEWTPYIPEEPSAILTGLHSKEEGKFWLSMDAFDAGYLYECKFFNDDEKKSIAEDQLNEPVRTIPVEYSDDTPITVFKLSKDRKRAMCGLKNGAVRIIPLQFGDVSEMGASWTLNVHDNHYGQITHIASSYDDNYLFTVGSDGNFFTFNVMGQEKMEERVAEAKAKIPSAKPVDIEKRIDDIEDPKAYSIEDAKQKSEYDKMMQLAERKKARVKNTIKGLRSQFRRLLERNLDLPPHLRLDRKEFELDAAIKKELQQQTQDKITQVKKELAWEQEKCRLALDKLRSRFKDMIECEHIVIRAFLTPHEVSTFRASKLPEEFYAVKAEMEKRKTTFLSGDPSRQATQDPLMRGQTNINDDQPGQPGEIQKEATETKMTTTLKGSMGERINKALAKVEEKKKKRAARRAQWAELMSDKPDDNYEDPADLSAIKSARENMGDYKLKSASDYVVPDHLRMNAEKAKARLLVLKDLIHQHKYEFNQRLLNLRDKKIGIIEEIKEIIAQLNYVQSLLGSEYSLPLPEVPRMGMDELPEKKFEYTREILLKFKEELEQREKNKGKPQDEFSGFGGPDTQDALEPRTTPSPTPSMGSQRRYSVFGTEPGFNAEYIMSIDEDSLTPLEKQLRQAEQIKLLYERDQLFKKINELLKNFDAELRVLRHDKFKMDIDLKNADLRQVTLFEELLLLKEFEKRENVLAAKVEAKHQERLEMQAKVLDVQAKLDNKKKDIEKLLEKERTLNMNFQVSLGENNKFADYLNKVFKKKIKRTKKKTTEGDGSDEESEEESSDESDWSESDEESDSEAGGFDLDVCPPGCDQNLYDNTCALREKRLDIEEGLAEEKKVRDTLNKELEALQKKAKIIDIGVKNAESELEAFQLEKQQKLNELDVVVTLKLHQLQHTVNNVLPQDLTQCLVFEATGLVHLQHRIKELEHEKSSQKKQQKDAKRKHIQLIKDRKVFASRISEMQETCDTMMMQKFGRIVDLEKIETVTVNRNVEELKEKLRVNETLCSKDLLSWDERVTEARDRITELIRENTHRLDQLNILFSEKKAYQVQLDARQKNLGGEFSGERKSDIHERQRLIQLVHLQAQEVEALKEEITLLSRKGGHILPPAQPPLPPSAQQRASIPNT